MSPCHFNVPSFENMKQTVQEKFGLSPCTWQLQAAQYQLNSKDVIMISPTGSRKTLTFWIPLIFNAGGIIIIVTPLNILGEKNQKEAEALGFPAINLCKETASDQAFKDIEKLKYCIIMVSPERLLSDSHFQALWKSKKFTETRFQTFRASLCIFTVS
ncbi:uncharacterized protein EDB93DRAFT_1087047 [Suillus bovinus]|uniref:uncharacterized protein n=1 Tax=Suillus bovinus TaxID=48563 RepID=UPI001B861E72|nr:uncharacterized protein EDB93DRAFT_1087047 [Suillus bovinus]KAG2145409.1 hypothetical protein EDB93DRAFT_1087047 [Suillus bovinus]